MGLLLIGIMVNNTDISAATSLKYGGHIAAVNALSQRMKNTRHAVMVVITGPEESCIKSDAKLRCKKYGNGKSRQFFMSKCQAARQAGAQENAAPPPPIVDRLVNRHSCALINRPYMALH